MTSLSSAWLRRVLQISFLLLGAIPLRAAATAADDRIANWVSSLISSITKCHYVASPVSRQAGDAPLCQSSFRDVNGRTWPVTVLNDEYSLKLFQGMMADGKIPFGFPEDGCYARAHQMSLQLSHQSPPIASGKVFAIGEFHLDNDQAAKGYVSWGFHVAPFIVLDNGHGRQIWVIDPSLFYQPEPLEKWLTELTRHDRSKLTDVYLTSRYIYHPRQKKKELSDFDPRDLQAAEIVMKQYRKKASQREKARSDDF